MTAGGSEFRADPNDMSRPKRGLGEAALSAGVIGTEGFSPYPGEALVRFHKTNPMEMRGSARDVAEQIAYLASPGGMPGYFSEDGAT